MMSNISTQEEQALNGRFLDASPEEVIAWTLERFKGTCAIAFSGAEDVALIEFAHRTKLPYSVFCLDTGRLHEQTYRFLERVRHHYNIEIHCTAPDARELETLTRKKGLFSFFEDGHKECCSIRKVAPLRRVLKNYSAWITGQRIDQSPDTRAELQKIAIDDVFSSATAQLIKVNPLATWTSAKVWAFIKGEHVPYNALHDEGFRSIGCAPCTRPIEPHQHEREGRWWWENPDQKECGLHMSLPDKR